MASIPSPWQALASGSTLPPRAITGFPYFFASRATPTGVFPMAVWPSSRPSPVITRSAVRIFSSSPVSRSTMEMPGSRAAPRKEAKANPRPPAAPAPGAFASAEGMVSSVSAANRPSQSSIFLTVSGSAPFCGPYTALHPEGPHRGLVTSQATRNWHLESSGSRLSVRIRQSPARPEPFWGMGFPASSSS